MKIRLAQDRKMRTFDKNGHLIVESTVITKADVNEYLGEEINGYEELGLQPKQRYKLLRDPEELQKGQDTFKSLQLMVKHIQVDADDPKKEYTIGSLGSEISFDGIDLRTSLRIYDGEAIRLIQSGKLEELSASYYYDADMQKGEYNGIEYDGIMRNIHGNHVALVHHGRIGRDAIIADSVNDLLGVKMKLKKGAYSKIATRVKKSLALDEEIPTDKLEEIVESVLDEIPDDQPANDEGDDPEKKKKDDPANDDDPDGDDPANDEGDGEGDDPKKPAMDTNELIAKAIAENDRKNKLGYEAMERVRPLVGSVAFDSAENIYRKALKQTGVNYKGTDIEAMQLMIDQKIEAKNRPSLAQDSAIQPKGEKPKALQRIG